MADIDSYLQPRKTLTENMYWQHYQEVSGLCPLCGVHLLQKKNGKTVKLYEVAHIYPNSPTESQKRELEGIERLGVDSEDFNNKIALCLGCHTTYDRVTTVQDYLRLLNIKKQLLAFNKAQESMSHDDIQEELIVIIENLSRITDSEIEKTILKYKGVKISNKIEDKYVLLKHKIQFYANTYYNYIKESFKLYHEKNNLDFELIAAQVKTAYLKGKQYLDNQEEIFKVLVKWLNSKIPEASENACEIMIAFFVQNCEVFDEISK